MIQQKEDADYALKVGDNDPFFQSYIITVRVSSKSFSRKKRKVPHKSLLGAVDLYGEPDHNSVMSPIVQ